MEAVRTSSLERRVFAILLSVAVVITWQYFFDVHVPNLNQRLEMHTAILRGVAPAPYQYRVLTPLLAEGLARLLASVAGYRAGVMIAYVVIDLFAFGLFLPLMYRFLRTWFSTEQSMIGALVAAALMPMSLRNHFYQPWSSVENVLVVLALILMVRQRLRGLAIIVLIAALTRETTLFIVVAYALTAIPWPGMLMNRQIPWQPVRWAALYAGIWAVVFVGLRAALGLAPDIQTMADFWEYNLQPGHYAAALINVAIFLGAFWLFAIRGFRVAPHFVRWASGIIPLYILSMLLHTHWDETRPLIPAYPLFMALGLAYVFPGARRNWPEFAAASRATSSGTGVDSGGSPG